jgi:hypothetical protein
MSAWGRIRPSAFRRTNVREGTVSCPEYASRFKVRRSGAVQIIWSLGKGPPPGEDRPVGMAAQEAIDAVIRPSG